MSGNKELTISLIPEAVITGRVVLPSSDAPDRIRVELYQQWVHQGRAYWQSIRTATTRFHGEFRFADLPSGTYKLLTRELEDKDPLTVDPHGQPYGYPPVYFPNAQDFASAQAIQLAAGQTFQGADIAVVRQAYYPVKVVVENIHELMVQLKVYAEGRGPGYELGYNRKDHTIVGTLPNGNYTLEVSTFELAAFKGGTGLLNITVKGGPVEGPRLLVVPNGSITVVVTEDFTLSDSPNGRPPDSQNPARNAGPEDSTEMCVRGQCETLRGPSSYLNLRFEPDANIFDTGFGGFEKRGVGPEGKSFVIENVRPGRYWIRIDSRRGYPARINCGGVDLEHQPLVIGVGGSNSQIEVTMRDDGAEVEGMVDGMARTASETGGSAAVYLIPLPDGGGEYREAEVSPEGKFNFEQVPPGLYEALAIDRTQPRLEYRNSEAMRAYESKGQVVRLSPGQKEQLRLQVISTSE
ncbi:MAG TPA: carboxypeptidase-like regulatory domain-containing protein [Terriglobales bacterium]|nr:carboxypeptidase-like regulatory domain-containing protein [Terriglobales bacterium]